MSYNNNNFDKYVLAPLCVGLVLVAVNLVYNMFQGKGLPW